ncbi:hypothetical protein BDV93DRAFT_498621 [Ceratobasidium sp. AG-I]|nr:hypothetical protein BDV93DRAFT_498621 [Ceratobasidium sp. AG-I]
MFEIGGEGKQDNEEGSSPENPIIMSEVAASDFEALLTILYASRFSTSEPDPDASVIVPAFRLANMWNFIELRSSLLPLAEKALGDIDKILFGRQFNVEQWLEPAHTNLCQRPEPLTTDEAMKLGIHSVLLISHMREEFHPAKVASGLTSCGSCLGYNLNSNRWCSDCSCHSIQLIAKPISHNKVQEKVKKWVKNGCVLGCVNM